MPINEQIKKSEICLKDRRELSVSGVEEVVSFDTEGVRLITALGELMIEGDDIKIGTLDTESGRVCMNGKISGMYYINDSDKQRKGFFGRLVH